MNQNQYSETVKLNIIIIRKITEIRISNSQENVCSIFFTVLALKANLGNGFPLNKDAGSSVTGLLLLLNYNF